MAKATKLTELPELLISEPNMFHIQESYLRQMLSDRPLTAKKKNKSEVDATGAKWFRQKGTGRARQGEQTNPHMYGGGLAFPPTPRTPRKRINKQVRVSALRSAVLAHIKDESCYLIESKDFEQCAKTKDVAAQLSELAGSITLVIPQDAPVWRSSRNLLMVRQMTAHHLNVRDLVETDFLVFSASALDDYRALLKEQSIPLDELEVEVIVEDETGGDK
jgi:large subunit ribosomal protein L4